MDKMQAKIEKFDKKLSKQETSFGTEENYRELLVKYNSLLTTLGEVAARGESKQENITFEN